VASVQGRGTRVTLSIPLLVEGAVKSAPHVEDAPSVDVPPQVLLLEDDPFLAQLLRRALTRGGFDVLAASSVAEAERILTRDGGRISAVTVERELEGGGKGMAVVRAAWRTQPDLPAVVLDRQGRDGAAERVKALRTKEGIPAEVPLLPPPFEPTRFVDILQALLDARDGEQREYEKPAATSSAQGEGEPPVH
jgi:DNA-binding NtrC family response regulator